MTKPTNPPEDKPVTARQKAIDTAYKQGYAAGRRLANKEEAARLEIERREDRRTALFCAALTGILPSINPESLLGDFNAPGKVARLASSITRASMIELG